MPWGLYAALAQARWGLGTGGEGPSHRRLCRISPRLLHSSFMSVWPRVLPDVVAGTRSPSLIPVWKAFIRDCADSTLLGSVARRYLWTEFSRVPPCGRASGPLHAWILMQQLSLVSLETTIFNYSCGFYLCYFVTTPSVTLTTATDQFLSSVDQNECRVWAFGAGVRCGPFLGSPGLACHQLQEKLM